jgi:hypothetical protein
MLSTLRWVSIGVALLPLVARAQPAPPASQPAAATTASQPAAATTASQPAAATTASQPAAGEDSRPASQPAIPVTVMLPLEGDRSQGEMERELIQRCATLGRPVQRAALGLEDLQLGVGCSDLSISCLQKIGKAAQAELLLLVHASRLEDRIQLDLRLVDVASGSDHSQTSTRLPADPGKRDLALNATLVKLFGIAPDKAGLPQPKGTLEISASVPYVEVAIEGQPRGALPLTVRLPVGTYQLRAFRNGYRQWSGEATVREDQSTNVAVYMIPLPTGSQPRSFIDALRLPSWIAGGATVLTFGIGVAFGAHMLAQQNDYDNHLAETPEDIRQMQSIEDSGERDAVAANVMFGIAGALAITTAVLVYIDYQRSQPPPAEQPPAAGAKASARLRLGPGVAGLDLSF